MQKKLIFLALTGLLCLSLAGCGQSGSTSPEGGSSPQAEQPAEETAGEDGGRTPEEDGTDTEAPQYTDNFSIDTEAVTAFAEQIQAAVAEKNLEALADQLREHVRGNFGLTISVGVSFNKVFAKLGSDYKKPDATTVISRENWRSIVWPLPVGDLLYVGGAAQKLLGQYGVKTIGQLAACKKETLETLMGKMGTQLYEYANGLDSAPVRARLDAEPVKSVGNGTTFPQNLTTCIQVRSGIAVLADSVATRLRHSGLYAGGVQVTVRDPQFHDRSRQMQLSAPTHLIRELTAAAMDLTGQLWKPPAPVRALTVTAIHLVRSEDAYEQVDLFTAGAAPKKEKQEKLEAAMDRLRGKFGTDVISYGAARPEKEEDPLP